MEFTKGRYQIQGLAIDRPVVDQFVVGRSFAGWPEIPAPLAVHAAPCFAKSRSGRHMTKLTSLPVGRHTMPAKNNSINDCAWVPSLYVLMVREITHSDFIQNNFITPNTDEIYDSRVLDLMRLKVTFISILFLNINKCQFSFSPPS